MRLVHALTWLALALGGPGGAAWASVPSHCAELARRLPNLTRSLCERAALTAPGPTSVKGVPLYQRDVLAPRPESVTLLAERKPETPRRRVLVIGGIHGDELSSTALVFHWIAHASDTAAEMDWRFVPAINPDGLLLPRPTRVNANGVDLNRNFPTPHWDKEAPVYWQKRTKKDPRRWPGRAALSEPESRFVVDTMAACTRACRW
jgi:murein peptide amidase A